MTDMTNETALQVLKWLHDEPERTNITRAALTLAIAALQHPVVTREEIARLAYPMAFQVDHLFRKDWPPLKSAWIKLFTRDMWAIQSAYDRADTILQLFQAQGSDLADATPSPAQGGLGTSAGTKVTREALESYLMDMPHDLNSSSGLAAAASEIFALLEGEP